MLRIVPCLLLTLLAACAPMQTPVVEPVAIEPEIVVDTPAAPPRPVPTIAGPPAPAPLRPSPQPPVQTAVPPTPVETETANALSEEAAPVFDEEIAEEALIVEESATLETEKEDFFDVRLSFATNRSLATDPDAAPRDLFTNDVGPLIWGQADVTIPAVHERGVLETPGWLENMLFGMNPARHVVLENVLPGTEEAVLAALRLELAQLGDSAILAYVHGYATDFEKAARRMAQMKHDLQFEGPALFFSWPSRGVPAAYPQDSNMVRVTQPAMQQVLRKLAEQPADRIVLIAHSMGTQVLSYALADLLEDEPALADRFRAVILAAPDIDERVFNDQLIPAFRSLPEPVTLYASSNDAALKASRRFNGYPRIGDASEVLGPLDNVVVIDASNVVSDFFGHRYFAENTSILHDIYQKVVEGLTVDARNGLISIQMSGGTIYRITGR